METDTTKKMKRALVSYITRQGKHIALEVPFWHTVKLNFGYGPVGHSEYVDAVSEYDGIFTCYELKISMSDLRSKAAQTFEGNKNYLVCPLEMAMKIKKRNDCWISQHPTVGIMAWTGEDNFKIIKRCKEKYDVKDNDWHTLAKGMMSSLSQELKTLREPALIKEFMEEK